MHVCARVCVCVVACVHRPDVNLRYHFRMQFTLLCKTGTLVGLEISNLASMAGYQALEICLSLPSGVVSVPPYLAFQCGIPRGNELGSSRLHRKHFTA